MGEQRNSRQEVDQEEIDRYLDLFPSWLVSLADDAKAMTTLVQSSTESDTVRGRAVSGLNYLFRSLDLIPDGIEDLGFLDDAFVLRASALLAAKEATLDGRIAELAQEAEHLKAWMGDDYARLETYVLSLESMTVRGRTVAEILGEEEARANFVSEVFGWATSYEPPSFGRDAKNLVKLRSFLLAKLP